MEKNPACCQSSRDFTSNLGPQPHTAKTCLLSDLEAEQQQGRDTCILPSSTTPPQTKDSLALHVTAFFSLLASGS